VATKSQSAESSAPSISAKPRRRTDETTSASRISAEEPSRSPGIGKAPRTAKPASAVDEDANDETTSAAIARAESAFSAGRLATARLAATESVTAARKAAPSVKVRAFVILGKVELASEEFAEAAKTFDRALAIAPNDPVARKGKERAKDAAAKAGHP